MSPISSCPAKSIATPWWTPSELQLLSGTPLMLPVSRHWRRAPKDARDGRPHSKCDACLTQNDALFFRLLKTLETWTRTLQNSPRHSMYAIYAYIGVVRGVNVGIYMAYMECMGNSSTMITSSRRDFRNVLELKLDILASLVGLFVKDRLIQHIVHIGRFRNIHVCHPTLQE